MHYDSFEGDGETVALWSMLAYTSTLVYIGFLDDDDDDGGGGAAPLAYALAIFSSTYSVASDALGGFFGGGVQGVGSQSVLVGVLGSSVWLARGGLGGPIVFLAGSIITYSDF